MRTIKYILAGFIVLMTSCSEDFVNLTNPNEMTTGSFWQTEGDAILGTNAMYQALIYDGTYMRFGPWVLDIRADDVISTTPGYYPEDVANYIVDVNNLAYIDVWRHNYIGVWRANQVLNHIEDITMDENLKARCKGEAYFIRGLCYFNLLINFRNVVLYPKEVESVDDYFIPQSSPDESWEFAIQNFRDAVAGCWLKSDPKNEMGRATKGAAAAFLAKSLMINRQFDEAASVLKDIMNTADGGNQLYGEYSLVANYRDNFTEANENNAESLFELQYQEVAGTSVQGFDLDPASDWMKVDACHKGIAAKPFGWGDMAPTPWIYQEFQQEQTVDGKRDPRMEASLFFPHPEDPGYTVYGYPGDSMLMQMEYATPDDVPDDFYVYIRKWLTEDEASELAWRSYINRRIMRYADVLLMYAECLNEAGQTTQAYTYIQKVRDRANLPDLATVKPGMTQEQMREQLDHERALEFCFEAWRYVDLLRWGYFDDPAKVEMLRGRDVEFNNWTTGREYLAIPPGEINRTRSIVKQNPGWN
jgi:hypothetical protein